MDTVATVGCSTAATDATTKVATVATITTTGGWLTVTTDNCLSTSPNGVADCTAAAVVAAVAVAVAVLSRSAAHGHFHLSFGGYSFFV